MFLTGSDPDNNRMRRSERLKGRKSFALFARARHYRGMLLRMAVVHVKNEERITADKQTGGGRKVAFVVPKKVCPRAVDRNRLKRWLRELYKKCRNLLPQDIQIMIIALPSALEALSQAAGFEAVHAEIEKLFAEIAKKSGDRRR